jgi:hypothetical protein
LEARGKSSSHISTLLSDAKRIEKSYQEDLDVLYARDRLLSIIAELRYTIADQRQGRPNSSKIETKPTALGPYRSAAAFYQAFRDSSGGTVDGMGSNDNAARHWDETDEQRFGLERDLQSTLRAHICQLEEGLEIIDGGIERSVNSGLIDITARDAQGDIVVIELKAGRAGRNAIGQILSYMGDVTSEEGGTKVRGILVAHEFDQKAQAAASIVLGLTLTKYSIHFRFTGIPA